MLTDTEITQAQEDYIKRAYQQAKVVLNFPLAGYRRDECLGQAQDAKTLKAVGEWLKRIRKPDYYSVAVHGNEIEALLRGEMPEG